MAIDVYHSSDLNSLAERMGWTIGASALGPFERETIAVPDGGIQRWLAQMLTHHITGPARAGTGISAGIDYRRGRHLVELFSAEMGREWQPHSLAWRILGIAEARGGPGGRIPLATEKNRYLQARAVAGKFLTYGAQRPGMLRAWLEGRAVADATGSRPLSPDLHWQMDLFRELTDQIGYAPVSIRPAEAVSDLRERGIDRFHVFGYDLLSEADVQFLREAADSCDIHVWLVGPSPHQWDPPADRGRGSALLEMFGAASGDLAARFRELLPTAPHTRVEASGAAPTTLLGRVQADIENDAAPTAGSAWDSSVQVHSCHGASRQVEVLREVLTGLFEDDPRLQPRDVLILCPDLDEYAPLFSATFGCGSTHPGRHLRVQVSGGRNAGRNPLADLAVNVLMLASDRVRSTALIDLLRREEVRRRLRISEADVERIETWVHESGIRWGFDGEDRQRFGLATDQNSIDFGLDRLLLGAALAGEAPLAGVCPHDAAGSTDLDLLGVFAEFTTRLRDGIRSLHRATTIGEFGDRLRELISSIAAGDEGQQMQADRIFSALSARGGAPASIRDAQAFVEELTDSPGSGMNLRTGALTVAQIGSLRAVPHKVICLVGMDEGNFPRSINPSGDDVLARHPGEGEWHGRVEDRQAFLEAITAATSHLLLTYSGAGQERGEEQFPAVPLAQLIDTLRDMTGQERITVHPLHPFDHWYFRPGQPRSFDERAARASRVYLDPAPAEPAGPLTAQEEPLDVITLGELRRFLNDPVKMFITDRLGVSNVEESATIPTTIPIAPGGLEGWAVGDRILKRSQSTGWARVDYETEAYLGTLPPGRLGQHQFEEINKDVAEIARVAATHITGPSAPLEVKIQVDGLTLRGRVNNIYDGGNIVHVSYRSLAPRHRLNAWVELLALRLAEPQVQRSAIVIGRGDKKEPVLVSHLQAPPVAEARAHLTELIGLYRRGTRELLPLPSRASAAWAGALRPGQTPDEWRPSAIRAAKGCWQGNRQEWQDEGRDRYQQIAWGGIIPFEELLAIEATEEEMWEGEPSRLGSLAMRMWRGMMDHES